jgi:hypothetical protein
MIVMGVCQQDVRNLLRTHAGRGQALQQLAAEACREQLGSREKCDPVVARRHPDSCLQTWEFSNDE